MPRIYKNNYLKQVIFRIDFEKVVLGNFDEFKKIVDKRFDQKLKRKNQINNLSLELKSGEFTSEPEEVELWQFVNSKTNNKFEIGPTHCLVEYYSYKDSSDLKNNVQSLFEKFLQMHEVTRALRIGLRYINQIEMPNLKKVDEWSKYITHDLLVAQKFLMSKGKTPTRILNQSEFKTEAFNTVFKYGIWNEKYPSPITNNAYILDIDCFTRLPMDVEGNKLLSIFSNLNKEAESIFEFSIKDELRKEMGK